MSTTQLNSKALEWLHKFFDAGDAMDVQRWIDNFYAEDAIVQFGNNPEIHGAEAIKAMFESVFPALESMKH
ncbi:hypothetical protein C8J56DRAFT_206217 [Mycena floridula]|nr:hypothetical protein C8J56DRAFT_206217 [Mycena floridula]